MSKTKGMWRYIFNSVIFNDIIFHYIYFNSDILKHFVQYLQDNFGVFNEFSTKCYSEKGT